jgi:hypothetical protein
MKFSKLLLIGMLAAACANANAQDQPAVGSFAMDSELLSTVTSPGSIVPKPDKVRRNPVLRANFPNAQGGAINNMRDTSTFGQQEATNSPTPDQRLIVLAGLGLIVLQLQRKHKSLLQRRITPSS